MSGRAVNYESRGLAKCKLLLKHSRQARLPGVMWLSATGLSLADSSVLVLRVRVCVWGGL